MRRLPRPRFVLHLEVLHRDGDESGMRRLRSLLKTLLRGWGMRCRNIEYPPDATPAPADDDYAYPVRPPEGRKDA